VPPPLAAVLQAQGHLRLAAAINVPVCDLVRDVRCYNAPASRLLSPAAPHILALALAGPHGYSAAMRTRPPKVWQLLVCILLLGVATGTSQQQLPDLEQLRLAAEHGDPIAQHKFGELYLTQDNSSTAFEWFQKAANQGNTNSQYRLSQMLMDGKPRTVTSKAPVPKNTDEALRWLLLLANQGYGSAQLDLARCYGSGKAVNRDIVEAYKWYKLIALKSYMGDQTYMNPLVLGMTHDQIQEGEKRAREWTPHQTTDQELLEMVYLREITLKGIAVSGGRRMAIINSEPLAQGGEAKVRAGQKIVSVRCLEIRDRSAIVLIEGLQKPKELSLK
jgi:Tfp pilus assembly protein PilP